MLAPELQHLLSQQDAEEKNISDDQITQELEMKVTRIRNSRAIKKSKQTGRRKQKKLEKEQEQELEQELDQEQEQEQEQPQH